MNDDIKKKIENLRDFGRQFPVGSEARRLAAVSIRRLRAEMRSKKSD